MRENLRVFINMIRVTRLRSRERHYCTRKGLNSALKREEGRDEVRQKHSIAECNLPNHQEALLLWAQCGEVSQFGFIIEK